MANTQFIGNAQAIAQVDSLLVTGVTVAGTLTATISDKNVTYTIVTGDTVNTAAANWQALLSSSNVPPEFAGITFTVSGATITATANEAGTPFTMSKSQAGSATCTLTHLTANSSPSDAGDANNYLRNGAASLPQNGDTLIFANCTIPVLWNLTALAAVTLASVQRWGSHTGQIGLPDRNTAGYREYRATRLQLTGSGTLTAFLGLGPQSGPQLERYDFQAQHTSFNLTNCSGADFIGSSSANTIIAVNSTFIMAPAQLDTSALTTASIDNCNATFGPGVVSFSGNLNINASNCTLYCAPADVECFNGSTLTVTSTGLTYPIVKLNTTSYCRWNSDSTITLLVAVVSSTFDKSGDARPMTITGSTVDGDTCQIVDPWNAITYTNATTVRNQVTAGPFVFTGSRTMKLV